MPLQLFGMSIYALCGWERHRLPLGDDCSEKSRSDYIYTHLFHSYAHTLSCAVFTPLSLKGPATHKQSVVGENTNKHSGLDTRHAPVPPPPSGCSTLPMRHRTPTAPYNNQWVRVSLLSEAMSTLKLRSCYFGYMYSTCSPSFVLQCNLLDLY